MNVTMDDIMNALTWMGQNWATLVLTGEMIGAVCFVKFGKIRKGILMLMMAIATVWIGAIA